MVDGEMRPRQRCAKRRSILTIFEVRSCNTQARAHTHTHARTYPSLPLSLPLSLPASLLQIWIRHCSCTGSSLKLTKRPCNSLNEENKTIDTSRPSQDLLQRKFSSDPGPLQNAKKGGIGQNWVNGLYYVKFNFQHDRSNGATEPRFLAFWLAF